MVFTQDPITQTPRTLKFDQLSRRFETTGEPVNVVPTLAFVQGPDCVLFGEQVRSQRLGFTQPQRLFQSFKRDLVADYRPPARQIDQQTYTAEIISELFLKQLKEQLTNQRVKLSQVLFTVPVGAFEHYLD